MKTKNQKIENENIVKQLEQHEKHCSILNKQLEALKREVEDEEFEYKNRMSYFNLLNNNLIASQKKSSFLEKMIWVLVQNHSKEKLNFVVNNQDNLTEQEILASVQELALKYINLNNKGLPGEEKLELPFEVLGKKRNNEN